MSVAVTPTIDALATDWLALLGLAALIGALVYVGRRLDEAIALLRPIATSPLVRAASSLSF